MKRILVFTVVMLAAAVVGFSLVGPRGRFRPDNSARTLPAPRSEAEKQVLTVLEEAQQNGPMFQSVPATDGRMLRWVVESTGARNVVEIGTSTGISGLWLCLGLQKTSGRLTTFEYDSERAVIARRRFQNAGVDRMVTVVEGDVYQTVADLREPIDVLFINADKEGYLDYLNELLPLVRSGGLILAHSVGVASDYTRRVTTDPALETLFYREGAGLWLTLKKHPEPAKRLRLDSAGGASGLFASLF